MKRLSSPITELKHHYEVVVVGSGYGGSIAASRMARIGKKVCLLEKGKEFLPGEFPSTLGQASPEMQITKDGQHLGHENGLYEFVMGDDISVFKGCGLGGTSLVNANVSIEADERVFSDERWPAEVRNNMASLKDGIAKAFEMLKPAQYPEGKNGYPFLKKTDAMKKSAAAMGEQFRLLDINVNFEDQLNHVGVDQKKCNNCGDCVTGCNHKAKNTTQMNYLPDAKNHGAEIFTQVGVSHVEHTGGQWLVYFNVFGTDREKFDAPPLFITADNVILSAGSLGSTEILLRSAEKGLPVSDMLGKHFTGNGDVLSFGYNNDVPIQGIGLGHKAVAGTIGNVGPCITSIVDLRNKEKLEDGMTLEEGSAPAPIKTVLHSTLLPLSKIFGKDTDSGFGDFLKEKWREVVSFFGGPYRGAVHHTQVYLVMSHDNGKGEMKLNNNRLNISWPGVGREKIFELVNQTLKNATKALGGTHVKNPTWSKLMNYDLVTVHPLGGCVMGNNAATAVVNHKGEVFFGTVGTAIHRGLYVMDGAIIPRSLGTNPLLTISGFAERNCKLIAEDMGQHLSYEFPSISPSVPTQEATGVQFTETMTGYFSKEEKDDYTKAHDLGKAGNSPFTFTLTIFSEDVDKFLSEKDHEAGMFGTVLAPTLSPHPISISEGRFNLFVPDAASPGKKKMLYAMKLHTVEGQTYYFKGFKDIENNRGIDIWKDTTVLFVTLFNGENDESPILGKGKLKIEIADFAKQLGTMKAIHSKGKLDGLGAVTKFGKFFAGELFGTYF